MGSIRRAADDTHFLAEPPSSFRAAITTRSNSSTNRSKSRASFFCWVFLLCYESSNSASQLTRCQGSRTYLFLARDVLREPAQSHELGGDRVRQCLHSGDLLVPVAREGSEREGSGDMGRWASHLGAVLLIVVGGVQRSSQLLHRGDRALVLLNISLCGAVGLQIFRVPSANNRTSQ